MPKESPRQSLKHGSSRTARLARWLDQPRPKGSKYTTLRLEAQSDGEWSCVGSWEGSEVHHGLAETINEMATEYANELGSYVKARVVWWSEELQSYFVEFPLRVQPEDENGEITGQSFAGDVQSSNIQTQRHLEYMMRQHVGGVDMAMRALRETLGTTKEELIEALHELSTLRRENQQLRTDKLELEAQLEQAITAGEALAEEHESESQQNNVISLFTQAIQKQQGAKN